MSEPPDIPEWLTRIEAEYREMPGLQLTEPQMRLATSRSLHHPG